jgi:hypothetical protein
MNKKIMPTKCHNPVIEFIDVQTLRHIEGFSRPRVAWLAKKIQAEQLWTKPVVLDRAHHLVMDGQHRMEVAKLLGLSVIPAILYDYAEVDVWSLRPGHYTVTPQEVIARALRNDIYPYKTAKHRFPCGELPELAIPLPELLARDHRRKNISTTKFPKILRTPLATRGALLCA